MADSTGPIDVRDAGSAEELTSLAQHREFTDALVQAIFNHAPVPILLVGRDQQLLRANPCVQAITACHLQGVREREWVECLVMPEDRASARETVEQAFRGQTIHGVAHALTGIDGARREFTWTARPLTHGTGELECVLLIGRSTDESAESPEQRLTAERQSAIGQMASGIAHESRNALQQIGACAEMLAMELEQLPEALDLVTGIQEAESRLQRLFDDVRAYAIRLQIERRAIDVVELWRTAWVKSREICGRATLRLVEDFQEPRRTICGSPAYLEYALVKVLQNAIEAGGESADVEIGCRETELGGRPAMMIAVRDFGAGFKSEAIERACEPFYGTKAQGAGLGLTIARRIVEAHQGEMRLGNVAGGAIVEMVMPVDA